MTNNLNEKRSYAVIIAAILSSLILMIGGLVTGLVYAVREHNSGGTTDGGRQMAGYLLSDSAGSLRNSMSALRLCNEPEPAESINRTALVYAVRAETALECHTDDWADNRSKERFLNDISTVLHSYTPEQTIEISDKLYEYSDMFYKSVTGGEQFEYDGELVGSIGENGGEHADTEITEEDKAAAQKLISSALNTERAEYVGDWNGHIEFYIERNGKTGYALVCGDKIIEYSFIRGEAGEQTNTETAKQIALESAAACGYKNLAVKWCEVTGRSVSVLMCKTYDNAMACDDYATAVVYGGETVAFTAGNCDCEHKNIPTPKKSEREARRATRSGDAGTLVVRTMNGEERICYEYRYELEDGVHYVYVCAESGKQIEVK